MIRFFHHLSEVSGREAPFGAAFRDFDDVDLDAERARFRARELDALVEEWGDERVARRLLSEGGCADYEYRLDLAIFSNFLTRADAVATRESRVRAVFNEVRAGGLVIVVGGTGGQYPRIYDSLGDMAEAASLRRARSRALSRGTTAAQLRREYVSSRFRCTTPSILALPQKQPTSHRWSTTRPQPRLDGERSGWPCGAEAVGRQRTRRHVRARRCVSRVCARGGTSEHAPCVTWEFPVGRSSRSPFGSTAYWNWTLVDSSPGLAAFAAASGRGCVAGFRRALRYQRTRRCRLRTRTSLLSVVVNGNEPGQQTVNKATRGSPNRRKLVSA
jgi:hypothetical protein